MSYELDENVVVSEKQEALGVLKQSEMRASPDSQSVLNCLGPLPIIIRVNISVGRAGDSPMLQTTKAKPLNHQGVIKSKFPAY